MRIKRAEQHEVVAGREGTTELTRILIAYDGSGVAAEAATRALAAFGPDHEYSIITVIRPGLVAPTGSVTRPEASAGSFDVEDEDANAALLANSAREETETRGDIEDLLRRLHLTAREYIGTGDPGETLCRVAADERADVLVIGSHGRGLAHQLILGSVSHHVLQHAPCLVLVLGAHAV